MDDVVLYIIDLSFDNAGGNISSCSHLLARFFYSLLGTTDEDFATPVGISKTNGPTRLVSLLRKFISVLNFVNFLLSGFALGENRILSSYS